MLNSLYRLQNILVLPNPPINLLPFPLNRMQLVQILMIGLQRSLIHVPVITGYGHTGLLYICIIDLEIPPLHVISCIDYLPYAARGLRLLVQHMV